MSIENLEKLLQNDRNQVFLFTCAATVPFMFARHPWFVVNRKGVISRWEIFWQANKSTENCWQHLHKNFYPPFQGIEKFFFTNDYFWKHVKLVGSVEGDSGSIAERMADFLERSPERYPFCNTYALRGPNSNTYVQWVLDAFPDARLSLPWNAIGKSFKAQ